VYRLAHIAKKDDIYMQLHYLQVIALSAIISTSISQSVTPFLLSPAPTSPVMSNSTFAAESNPFFNESTLPFQAPPFDKIKDSDYQPALAEGMNRQLVEVEAIANNNEPPTFVNTIEAMERSGALLTRASKVFFGLTQANTNPTIQKIESEEAPKLAAHQDKIYLNSKLFARVKSLYDRRATLSLDPEAKYLVEQYY